MAGRFPSKPLSPFARRAIAFLGPWTLLACVFTAAAGCRSGKKTPVPVRTAPEDRKGIVGGSDVRANDIVTRSTVAILRGTNDILCTGTLIGPNTILSAAHCFDGGIDRSNLFVGFGLDVESVKTFKVTKVITHPEYDTEAPLQEEIPIHDTAVLRFEGLAPAGTSPALLAARNMPLTPGTPHILSGYGLSWTSTFIIWRSSGGAGTLRRVELSLTSALASSKQLKFTSTEGKAVCSGDSGGPAYLQQGNTLVVTGITSWGYSSCEQGLSVFSDVRAYRDWIDTAVAQLGTSSESGVSGEATPTPPIGNNPVVSPIPGEESEGGGGLGGGAPGSGSLGELLEPLWSAVASIDLDALRDAWQIVSALKAGTFSDSPGEIASKNEGKYTTTILFFVANTPSNYRCVHIRPSLTSHGRPWGAKEGAYVYYGPVRLSQDSNFDAFGCRWQNNGDYWYLY